MGDGSISSPSWPISISGVGFGIGFGHGFPITTAPILGTDLYPKDRSPCNGESSE